MSGASLRRERKHRDPWFPSQQSRCGAGRRDGDVSELLRVRIGIDAGIREDDGISLFRRKMRRIHEHEGRRCLDARFHADDLTAVLDNIACAVD